MSTAKLKGNAAGTGSVTIESPNTNSTRTLTLPDADGTLARTADIPAAGADTNLSNLSATGEQKVAQAWVNFNGTGTVAIRDSYNVSSITDLATGRYDINFSNALANTDYAFFFSATADQSDNTYTADAIGIRTINNVVTTKTASAIQLNCKNNSMGSFDPVELSALIFGD